MPGRSSNTANANDIYKFTGHERDAELGLDYMLARNYDPEIGRFLSVDPLYEKYPGLSPYMYVEGNPIRLIDPDGRAALDPILYFNRNENRIYVMDDNGTPGDYSDDYQIGQPIMAHNKTTTYSKGEWPDGVYEMLDQNTPRTHGDSKDGKGIKKDSKNGAYGELGILRAKLFEQSDGTERSGMGVHAGRENKSFFDRVTAGCIRVSEDGFAQILDAIKSNGPLQEIIIDSSEREVEIESVESDN